MAILNNSIAISAGGYDVNNSLRFRSSASAYLNRTPASAGNQQKFTWSGWVKIGYFTSGYLQAASGNSGNRMTSWYMRGLGSTGVLEFEHFDGTTTYNLTSSAVFRDPSAWYHIVVAVDTTQATSANRTKIYVNGTQQTFTGTYVPQNTSLYVNGTTIQAIGSRNNASAGYGAYFDGYLAETNFIDGQALEPSSFGETDTTTGVWKPKAYTGTYGTNGFYLKFSDIATTSGSNAGLGKDFSGNTNYWTTNNISVTSGTTYDAMKDSPTNTSATVANYAVLNPIGGSSASVITVSNGNLTATTPAASASNFFKIPASIVISSGKWYFEDVINKNGGTNVWQIGISGSPPLNDTSNQNGIATGEVNYNAADGNGNQVIYNNGSTVYNTGTSANGDIIGVAFDADNRTIQFYKNNVAVSTAQTINSSSTYYISVFVRNFGGASIHNINFGQRPFSYTPPTGFVALNTYNLPTPTILQGNKYMDAILYTGDGASTKTITGLNFQPDFLWIKRRDGASDSNLQDAVRGFSSSTKLATSSTYAENTLDGLYTDPKWGYVSAVSSTGFTVTKSTNGDHVNVNASPYVAWAWDANGTGSTNTAGSITSTVSVNATAGFSIVTYTGNGSAGATIGHGLGVAPAMVIAKQRSSSGQDWIIYNKNLPSASYTLSLNSTAAQDSTNFTTWNGTAPSSTLITLGSSARANGSGVTYVIYAWAEIAGFSKFGSYTGNGSADGPFVFTGFRPKFVLTKRTDGAGDDWTLFDTARNTYNLSTAILRPNTSQAELSSSIDLLSNGFKWRQGGGNGNESGGTYIFMAFAENPFKNALAR